MLTPPDPMLGIRSFYNPLSQSLLIPFPGGASGKEAACQCRRCKRFILVQSLGREDPLEEGMATHSSIRAWRIPWTEELGGLQSIGSQLK